MPIGPITPGSLVDVTADSGGAIYPLLQAPSPTMPVTAADIQTLTLALMNVQEALNNRRWLFDLVADAEANYSGTCTSTSYTGPTGSALLVPNCQQGDILVVSFFTQAKMLAGAADDGKVQSLIRDNYPSGSDTPIAGSEMFVDRHLALGIPYAITFSWVVQDDGSTRVGFQGKVLSSGDTLDFTPSRFLAVQHFRIGVP